MLADVYTKGRRVARPSELRRQVMGNSNAMDFQADFACWDKWYLAEYIGGQRKFVGGDSITAGIQYSRSRRRPIWVLGVLVSFDMLERDVGFQITKSSKDGHFSVCFREEEATGFNAG
jgi:hypothetical protein